MTRSFKIRFTVLVAAVVVAIAAALGVFRLPSLAERQIGTAYRTLDDAMRKRDAATCLAMLEPTYTETRLMGRPVPRAAAEARLRENIADWEIQSISSDILQFTVRKDGATAIVDRQSTGSIIDRRGAYGKKGARHRATVKSTEVDRWVHRPQGWRMASRNVTMATVTIDGKVYRSSIQEHEHDH